MGNDLETRLLIPLFEYLRTDPVIVDYKIFSRSCAEIMFFISFLLTNVCVIRGFFVTIWHNSETSTSFHDSLIRILKEEIGEDDDNNENEVSHLDENGNELATATESIDEIIGTEGCDGTTAVMTTEQANCSYAS